MNEVANLKKLIHEVRGVQVMLDSDLAELYQIETKHLLQGIKRNPERFPDDFMFQLTEQEWANLRSQNVTSSSEDGNNLRWHFGTSSYGGRRYLPFVFTEQGVAMLSSVLKSKRAAEMNVSIMRTFIKMRHFITGLAGVSKQDIAELKKMMLLHIDSTDSKIKKQNDRIRDIAIVLDNLIERPRQKRKIGFV